MLMRRAGHLIVVALAPCALATAQAQGSHAPACGATATEEMTPFDSTRISMFAGTFDVTMVDTTSIRGGNARRYNGRLSLWLQDTGPRRQASMARRTEDHKFLVGNYESAPPDTGEMWALMTSRAPEAPGVFWSDGFLRLGEFGSKSGISLYVRSVSQDELRGMWTSHAGMGVVVDFTGRGEPDEAGYFCARRIG